MSFEKLLTAIDVSEILDLKPARVYELCREKRLPFILIGQRQYRFSKTALALWIENGGNQSSEAQSNET